MIIKKISDDTVKVLVESEDINHYKVPYHKLSDQDEDSIEFIFELLLLIYEETGVSFLENAVNIQAWPAAGDNFFLEIQKLVEEEGVFFSKEGDNESDLYIFALDRIADLSGLMELLSGQAILFPERCELFRLAETYFVVMEFSPTQSSTVAFKKLLIRLCEFALPCRAPRELEGKLCERGRLVCPSLMYKNTPLRQQ